MAFLPCIAQHAARLDLLRVHISNTSMRSRFVSHGVPTVWVFCFGSRVVPIHVLRAALSRAVLRTCVCVLLFVCYSCVCVPLTSSVNVFKCEIYKCIYIYIFLDPFCVASWPGCSSHASWVNIPFPDKNTTLQWKNPLYYFSNSRYRSYLNVLNS